MFFIKFKMKQITIATNNDNSFLYKDESMVDFDVRAKIFELRRTFTNDAKTDFTVGMYNIEDKTVLFLGAKLSEVEVDGATYTDYEELATVLSTITFSKGGGSGTGGSFIPLAGTEEGKPVTGSIEIYDEENDVTSVYNGLQFSTNGIYFHEYTNGYNNFLRITCVDGAVDSKIQFYLPDTQGYNHNIIFPSKDLSSNRTSFLLDQDSISYSTDEIKTGGTWIDGKPIYRIVKLTIDSDPADIETRFPVIIIGTYSILEYTKTTD